MENVHFVPKGIGNSRDRKKHWLKRHLEKSITKCGVKRQINKCLTR